MEKHIWTSEKIKGNQCCNCITHACTHKTSLICLMVNNLKEYLLHWTRRKVLKQVASKVQVGYLCQEAHLFHWLWPGNFTTNPQAHSLWFALLKMQIGCNCIWHIVIFDGAARCIFFTVFLSIEWLKFFMQLSCSRAIFFINLFK